MMDVNDQDQQWGERRWHLCRDAAPPWTCHPLTYLRRKSALALASTLGKEKIGRTCAAGQPQNVARNGGAASLHGRTCAAGQPQNVARNGGAASLQRGSFPMV